MIRFRLIQKAGKAAVLGLLLTTTLLLSACSDGKLEGFIEHAHKMAGEDEAGFAALIDQPTIRDNFVRRGYSSSLLDSPTAATNPNIIAMIFDGRDKEDTVNLHYIRNETESTGEYVIQCINNPRSSLVFSLRKIDGRWKFVDYDQLPDPDGMFSPPAPSPAK